MNECHFCGTPVDDENFCHGCQEYVCEDCATDIGWSLADAGMGPHDVEAHQIEAEIDGCC